MADTVDVLITEFRADIKRYETSLRKQVRATENAARRNQRAFANANTKIRRDTSQTASFIKSRLGIIAIGAGLAAGTRVIADFGQAMSSVKAVSGATAAEFEMLRKKARELGATTRFSATEAAEGMLFLSRAGFTVDETMASIGPTLRLAQVGMLDLGDAADISSNILQGFRLDASEMERVVDVMAKTVNSSNTDVRQLGDAMKLVAPVAAGMGLSIEETSAAVGALSNAGLQATLAGTGLRRVIAELEAPTTSSRKILKRLGVTLDEVRPTSVGLTAALQRLHDAGIDTGTALQLFGQRGGPAFEVMASSIPDIVRMTGEFETAAGTADKMAEIMDDNLAGSLKKAMSRLQELILTIADAGAEDALIVMLEALSNILTGLSNLVFEYSEIMSRFAPAQRKAAEAVTAYAEAVRVANGLTGDAKVAAEELAEAKRKEARATIDATKAKLAEARAELEAAQARVKRGRNNPFSPSAQKGGLYQAETASANRSRQIAYLEGRIAELEADYAGIEDGTSDLLKPPSDDPTVSPPPPPPPPQAAATGSGEPAISDEFQAYMKAAEAAVQKEIEGLEKELTLLDRLRDARDEMHGHKLTIIDREYERRKAQIEAEISDEARKNEALALLADERAEYEKNLREQLLGSGSGADGQVEQVRAIEEEKLAALREALELELITREEFEARKVELAQATEDKLAEIRTASALVQLGAAEKLFGSMAGLAKQFAGEQSGLYKVMFAVEKAFAIASSLVSIQTGIANALSLPFPANLGAAATVAAQGASVVSNLRSVTASGFADGVVGLRGPGTGRSDDIPAYLSRGESVITAQGTARNAALLAAINSGQDVQGAIRSGSLAPRSSVAVSSGPLTIEGNVDRDVFEDLQVELARRDARLADEVNRIVDRRDNIATPRHRR